MRCSECQLSFSFLMESAKKSNQTILVWLLHVKREQHVTRSERNGHNSYGCGLLNLTELDANYIELHESLICRVFTEIIYTPI